jgi:hypothetical protein
MIIVHLVIKNRSSQVSSKFVVFSGILACNCALVFLEHHLLLQDYSVVDYVPLTDHFLKTVLPDDHMVVVDQLVLVHSLHHVVLDYQIVVVHHLLLIQIYHFLHHVLLDDQILLLHHLLLIHHLLDHVLLHYLLVVQYVL